MGLLYSTQLTWAAKTLRYRSRAQLSTLSEFCDCRLWFRRLRQCEVFIDTHLAWLTSADVFRNRAESHSTCSTFNAGHPRKITTRCPHLDLILPSLSYSSCYADFFHGGITMANADPLPSLLFKINQNQLALEAAIMELTLWVEQRGSGEVGSNVRGALATFSKNEELINKALAVLMTPE